MISHFHYGHSEAQEHKIGTEIKEDLQNPRLTNIRPSKYEEITLKHI